MPASLTKQKVRYRHCDTNEVSVPSLPPAPAPLETPYFFSSYEVNPEKIDEIEAGGLEFVGRDDSGLRMEIAEIPRAYLYTQLFQQAPLFCELCCSSLVTRIAGESAARS